MLDEEDFFNFVLCFLEEALTDSTGFDTLEPVPKSAEGEFESLLLWDLEIHMENSNFQFF